MRVGILEGHNFAAWRAEDARGELLGHPPYGLEHLARAVQVSHGDATDAGLYSRFRAAAGRALPPIVLIGGYLWQWLCGNDLGIRRRRAEIARSAGAT